MAILDNKLGISSTSLGRVLLPLMRLVLRDDLVDGNALELGFALSLLAFDLLVVGEVLEVFRVSVGLVGLGLRGRVVLLYSQVEYG